MSIITKPLKGYEGLYEINSLGEIYSLPKRTLSKRRILKTSINNSGYHCVSLCKNSKHKSFTVHRLLLDTFISERPKGMDIDHIDGDKLNNSITNLRYCSRSDNMKNARRNGFKNYGEHSKFAKLTQNQVREIRCSDKTQSELASLYKVSIATISRVLNNKIWVGNTVNIEV